MEKISKKNFEEAEELPPLESESDENLNGEMSKEEFDKALLDMQNPVQAQKSLAVKIKHFLDKRIALEMKDKGYLTDSTRKWVETFNNTLEKIQKALYGDKSVNLHMHKIVSHGQIAARMRKIENE